MWAKIRNDWPVALLVVIFLLCFLCWLTGCKAEQTKTLADVLQTVRQNADSANLRVRIPLGAEAGFKQGIYVGSGGWIEGEIKLKAEK